MNDQVIVRKASLKPRKDEIRVLAVYDEFSASKKGKTSLERSVAALGGAASAKELQRARFAAKPGESLVFRGISASALRGLILIGAAAPKEESRFNRLERFREIGAQLRKLMRQFPASSATLEAGDAADDEVEALSQGFMLSGYSFSRSSKKKGAKKDAVKQNPLTLIVERSKTAAGTPAKDSDIINQAICAARDLVNTPPNELRPLDLARYAQKALRLPRVTVQVWNEQKLRQIGANGILAVGQGSSSPSALIRAEYKPSGKAKAHLAFVGKGVTFDSGGYWIKTPAGMETMKCDMAGAAAVIGALSAIARLKLPIHISAWMPTVENMIDGDAMRSGDVVSMVDGTTVEILNTDAEGRLILADALVLAAREKPDCIVDLATLTGACMVALGDRYAGLFTNNDNLAQLITKAGEERGELYWRLPLAREYTPLLKSPIADFKNTFGSYGGAITAALFLEHFAGKTPWAHLDIAGTAFSSKEERYIPRGGVGFGVATLVQLAREIAVKPQKLR